MSLKSNARKSDVVCCSLLLFVSVIQTRISATKQTRQAFSAMCKFNLDRQNTTPAIRRTRVLPSSHAGSGSPIDTSRLLKAAFSYFSLFCAARRP
jgi:hypothetical protein